MENTIFLQTYILTFVVCITFTVGLVIFINKGLKQFFENMSQDKDIAKFFVKLTNIIIFVGGLGAALKSGYNTGEDSNWLTLMWDAADQFKESLGRLFLTLIIFSIAFFILHIVARRTNK